MALALKAAKIEILMNKYSDSWAQIGNSFFSVSFSDFCTNKKWYACLIQNHIENIRYNPQSSQGKPKGIH